MDDTLEKKNPEFGDPELNNEPETPIIPAPEPDETEPTQYAPVASVGNRKRNKRFFYLLAAILAVLILFFGFRMLTGGSKSSTPTPTPVAVETTTPSPTASEEASATPTPTKNPVDSATGLNRSNLSVEIQNGSGTAGAGAKASDLLKGLGYNVTSTGNADNFDYTDVTVKVKSTKKNYLPLLIKDLSSDYTIGSSSSELSASSSADALVIIGK